VLRTLSGSDRAAPLSVEVSRLGGDLRQAVVHLVVKAVDVLPPLVLEGDLRCSSERHGPIGVEPSRGVHVDGQRDDIDALGVAVAEEVAEGHLHRRVLVAIPVHAQDGVAVGAGVYGDPDVLDDAWPVDLRESESRAGRHGDTRADLPAFTQMRGGAPTGGRDLSGARALLSSRVLWRDRAGHPVD